MPRIFDNIDCHLLPALTQTMRLSDRADFLDEIDRVLAKPYNFLDEEVDFIKLRYQLPYGADR